MSFTSSTYSNRSYRRLLAVASILCTGLLPGLAGAQSFEQPPTLNASQVLGADVTKSSLYTVAPKVQNDGRYNQFSLTSSVFHANPIGNGLALERTLEVKAIDAMRKIKGTDAYAQGLENAIGGVLAASKEIITNPVQTLSDLPSNIGRVIGDVFSAIGNMGKSSSGNDDTLKSLIGYNKAKRFLADSLDVDPYSSNPVLQEELGDLAWVTFAGGATLDIPLIVTGASTAVTGVQIAAGVKDPLRDASPTSLVNINTQLLEQMGIKGDEADKFIFGKVLNVRHQTVIVHALASLKDVPGRDAFIRLATKAGKEHEARAYQATAMMIAGYHTGAAPVKRIDVQGDTVFITDLRKTVALMLAGDHVAWTAKVAAHVSRFPAGSGKRALWTDGSVSAAARSALEAKNITVQAQAFSRISPRVKISLTEK